MDHGQLFLFCFGNRCKTSQYGKIQKLNTCCLMNEDSEFVDTNFPNCKTETKFKDKANNYLEHENKICNKV